MSTTAEVIEPATTAVLPGANTVAGAPPPIDPPHANPAPDDPPQQQTTEEIAIAVIDEVQALGFIVSLAQSELDGAPPLGSHGWSVMERDVRAEHFTFVNDLDAE
eukprot:TRINITY_DN9513_c0_g1_i1.p2 TRINITY_DN9513_c0_g1~~TRINITY_DN9513_c0_g1_i1.p2  ORF type:complete len:105 (+),score=17.83 TRINITY_DN9513_c0_g1_i1:255-569(+)